MPSLHRLNMALVAVLFLSGIVGHPDMSVGADPSSTPSPNFMVFDGTLYRQKPNFTQYGIHPLKIIYGDEFYGKGENNRGLPEEFRSRKLAKQYFTASELAVINLEDWPLKGDLSEVRDGLSKYLSVLRWFHVETPNFRVGYYGRPPISDYSRAILDPSTREYQAWQAENDAIRPLYDETDIFFPSIYTFYSDREGWVKYAIAQIRETRRLAKGRPVYVFMWPQYHPSNQLLAYRYMSADFWKLQLETARQYADGLVIWGGWDFDANKQADWDDSASWWRVTKEFMEGKKSVSPPRALTVQ